MRIAYNGSHAFVDVPLAGAYGVKRGEPLDVDKSLARRLKRQGWTEVKEQEGDNGDGS